MAKVTSSTAWGSIVRKCFQYNQRISTGRPKVIVANAAPVANTDTAPIGTLWWHANGANDAGDGYLAGDANGANWIKLNT